MTWKKKFLNYINNFWYKTKFWFTCLFYGLKKADTEILSNSNDDYIPLVNIQQTIKDTRVAHHLLKGEITQEVVDLRYMDYLVSEKCRSYVFNGSFSKKINLEYKINDFKFENKLICDNVLDTLNNMSDNHNQKYTISINYDCIPKFKLEKYCKEVGIFGDTVCLKFLMYGDKYDVTSLAFINQIKRLINQVNHEFIKLNSLEFITNGIKSVKNLLNYKFINLSLIDIVIDENKKEILMYYNYNNLLIDDLTEKFYSENQQNKYDNKESKISSSLLMS